MIDSRWERIEQLFFEAAELVGQERDTFLDAACGGDAELRREVESLLATDATAYKSETIESTIKGAAKSLFAPDTAPDAMVGTRLGPWLILREIGRGGMGAVYLAERADAEFKKQVAIKLVKRGIDTDAVLHRFLHERQILASLGHPNIAGCWSWWKACRSSGFARSKNFRSGNAASCFAAFANRCRMRIGTW
jgi:hypothetical protein